VPALKEGGRGPEPTSDRHPCRGGDGSRAAAEALGEFQDASSHMARAVDGLNESVSRFRLDELDG
jgi:hypothetical protein